MAVDDNYREVIRKAGKEVTSGDNTNYLLQIGAPSGTTIAISDKPLVDDLNSTTTPLTDGSTFTGEWVERTTKELIVAIASDQSCSFNIQFSSNASDIEFNGTYTYDPSGINIPRRLVISRKFYRVVITNDSGSDMTYLRSQTSIGSFAPLASKLNAPLNVDQDAEVVRSIIAGTDPDGDYKNERVAGYLAAATTNTVISNGNSFTTGIMDLDSYTYFFTELYADQNITLTGEWFDDSIGTNVLRTFTFPYTSDLNLYSTGSTIISKYLRYTITNNSGFDLTIFHFRLKISDSGPQAPLWGIDQFIPGNVRAQLTRSVISGIDPDGVYQNVKTNQAGALETDDFLFSIARGEADGFLSDVKFGYNPDIDTDSTPEDVWQSGGLYTGQPAHSNNAETVSVVSSSAADSGANPAYEFNPNDITETIAWWRADSNTLSGTDVTTLVDLSGNDITATAFGTSPSYTSSDSGLNDLPTIDMNNGGYFRTDSSLSDNLDGASGVTVLALVKQNVAFVTDPIININILNNTKKVYLEYRSNQSYYAESRSNLNDGAKSTVGGSNNTAWTLIELNINLSANTQTIYENGASEATATSLGYDQATFAADSVSNSWLFLNSETSGVGDFTVADLIVIAKPISQTDRDNLTYYFNDRYDLSIAYNTDPTGVDGSGARSFRISGLDENFIPQEETIYLNGTSAVTTSTLWTRAFRGKVLTAGTGNQNAGSITVRHSTTTANIFMQIPAGLNSTVIGAYTVPAGKTAYIKKIRIALTRANGSAGSALISFRAREDGSVYRPRVYEPISTAFPYSFNGAIKLIEKTDIIIRVESVSDNNSQVSGVFEYILVDN